MSPIFCKGCESNLCPLETFLEAIKNKIVGDFATECASQKSVAKKPSKFNYTNLTFLIAGVFALTASVFTILCSLVSFRHIIKNKLGFSSRRLQNEYKFERINLTVGDIDEDIDDDDDEDDEIFDKNRLVIGTKS